MKIGLAKVDGYIRVVDTKTGEVVENAVKWQPIDNTEPDTPIYRRNMGEPPIALHPGIISFDLEMTCYLSPNDCKLLLEDAAHEKENPD